jgi:hypothetical protein
MRLAPAVLQVLGIGQGIVVAPGCSSAASARSTWVGTSVRSESAGEPVMGQPEVLEYPSLDRLISRCPLSTKSHDWSGSARSPNWSKVAKEPTKT